MKALLRRIVAGLAALVSKRQDEEELDQELHEYLHAAIEAKVAAGMSRTDATRAARAEMGSMEAVKDHVRDAGWETALESVANDARHALNVLRRHPGFALVTIATLALGIGANAAVFSVAHAVWLQPLPYPEPHRLLAVVSSQKGGPTAAEPISYPTFRDWQSQSRSMDAMAAYVVAGSTMTGLGDAEAPVTSGVTPHLFSLLGAAPMLGRTLLPDDARSASGRVVVLSELFWRERFGGRTDIVGQTVTLDGAGYTVVGVMAASFRFPHIAPAPQIWMPLHQFQPFQPLLEVRMAPFLKVIGRLRTGFGRADAQAEMETIAGRLREAHPSTLREQVVRVEGLQEHVLGDTRSSLVLLLSAVGVLLLMACTNVASLQLARTISRTRELAVRSALGAARSRLVRQFLVENLVLALAGGAVGLLVAHGALLLLKVPIGDELPQIRQIGIDRWVLGFTFVLSCAAAVVFGVLPVLESNGLTSSAHTISAGRGSTADRRHARSQNALVVLQVALALVMLVSAGLLVRSLANLHGANTGFNQEHLLTATINLPQSDYPTPERWLAFNSALLDHVRALPGIDAAALGVSAPFLGAPITMPFDVDGRPAADAALPMTDVAFASDGFFKAMQVSIVRGREFVATDRRESLRVAVVNEAFAKRFFGDQNFIGQRIHVGPPKGVWVEIVGLVGDTAQASLLTPPPAMLYMPYAQRPFWITSFVVRTSREPRAVAPELRQAVAAIGPGVPVLAIEPMSVLLQRSFAASSHRTLVLVLFGALAAVLAAIGIHGLVAYAVAMKTNEIGIRLALGAEPSRVRRAVLGQGVRLTGIGIALGLAMSFGVTQLLETLLYGVSSTDPLTFAGVIFLLLAVTAVACYLPARRATQVDPLAALRAE